jgi:hypothetical protein
VPCPKDISTQTPAAPGNTASASCGKGCEDPTAAAGGGGSSSPPTVTISVGISFKNPCASFGGGKACGEFPPSGQQSLAWQNFFESQKPFSDQVLDEALAIAPMYPGLGELSAKGVGWILSKLAGRGGAELTAEEIVQATARGIAGQGIDNLKGLLKPGELAAYERNPAAGSRFLGQAVHRQTAQALRDAYPGMFSYRVVGPDFLVNETGDLVELTTPQQVAAHMIKPGYSNGVMYATYTLPLE